MSIAQYMLNTRKREGEGLTRTGLSYTNDITTMA